MVRYLGLVGSDLSSGSVVMSDEDYTRGYRDGYKDGFRDGRKNTIGELTPTIPTIPTYPKSPDNFGTVRCEVCQSDIARTTGYVCMNPNCPFYVKYNTTVNTRGSDC